MSFPNKEVRQACWNARDSYWSCLDKNKDEEQPCKTIRDSFEKMCPSTWVKHFDRKRDYNKFKDRIMNEGFDPLDAKKT
ncbi:cytochrome C oxidase [Tropilaelaps mercedesae]|uniref:Cytochrome C oxidase n=1 Tax=Tropilaelaps mercedesae TaxID=418985 RepID=A0A1V9XAG8_9ACAR|nr:cytochrome C oxidase [Tropilaelaps mercedesae]